MKFIFFSAKPSSKPRPLPIKTQAIFRKYKKSTPYGSTTGEAKLVVDPKHHVLLAFENLKKKTKKVAPATSTETAVGPLESVVLIAALGPLTAGFVLCDLPPLPAGTKLVGFSVRWSV